MINTEMKTQIVDILHRGLSKHLITPFDSSFVLDTLHAFLSKYPNYRPQPARLSTSKGTTTARLSTSKGTTTSTSDTSKTREAATRETAERRDEAEREARDDKKSVGDTAEREARDEAELWKTIQPILDKAQGATP